MPRFHVFDHTPAIDDTDGEPFDADSASGAAIRWAEQFDEDENIARGSTTATVFVREEGESKASRFQVSGTFSITYSARTVRA